MRIRTIAAGLFAATMLAPAPAMAQTRIVTDADDIAHGVDVLRLRVTHEKRVSVHLKHANLRRTFKQTGGISIFLDTDRATKGPEFVLGTGLFATDYQLSHAEGWKAVGEPLTCPHRLRFDFAEDRTHVWFNRKCLGSPADVRVAVKAAGQTKDGAILVDWVTKRRAFTDWVAQG